MFAAPGTKVRLSAGSKADYSSSRKLALIGRCWARLPKPRLPNMAFVVPVVAVPTERSTPWDTVPRQDLSL